MNWIKDELPPLGETVECLLHYTPCPYYVRIGIRKLSDEKFYTGLFYRKRDKSMSLGYIWTDGIGCPSAKVIAWRPSGQLSFNF